MPLIKLQTSAPSPDRHQVEALLAELSAALASHLRKPESYVMTAFEANVPMTFGGTLEPACYVEVKSIGSMSAQQTQTMSQDFCDRIQSALGVAPNRTYISFEDAKGYLWGWNSATFG